MKKKSYYQVLRDINKIEPTIASTRAPLGTICLEYAGVETCRPKHHWEGIRKNYVIHTIRSGKGWLRTGGRSYELHAGQAFAMFPGEYYSYEADEHDPWEYCWVAFQGYRCATYMKRIGFLVGGVSRYVLDVKEPDLIFEKVLAITNCDKQNCLDELKRLTLLNEVLIKLMEQYQGPNESEAAALPAGNLYVRYLVDYIDSHYPEKIKIAQIADSINMSRSYLTHSFKNVMHMPPKEYLTRVRMRQAQNLLMQTNKTITEIGRLCGYDDSMAFDKAFLKYYGQSPGSYRKTKDFYAERSADYQVYNPKSVL